MNKKEKYTFDGNWEFPIELDALNKFSFEKNKSTIKIIIRDFLNDDLEPYEEQIACINYVLQNQTQIAQTILDTIWKNWEEIKDLYLFDEWEDAPIIEEKNDLHQFVRIDEVFIKARYKDNISYIGILGNCIWDEEHGLGFVLHRNRVIEFGGAEEADAGGREANDIPDNDYPKESDVLKLYSPHPKFGTLKPAHKEANIDYPHKLIEKGLNQEFVNYLLDNPEPDFIHPEDWQKRTYLQTACAYNNEQIFNILLPVVQNFKKAIYKAHEKRNLYFIEKLIENGADINSIYFAYRTTILSEVVVQHFQLVVNNLTTDQMNSNQQEIIDTYNNNHPKEQFKKSRQYIANLISFGAVFDKFTISYAKFNNRHNEDALKAIDKEAEWIKELIRKNS